MKTLLNILTKIPITEKETETLLTDIESWIEFKINTSETKQMKETILPIQRENDGIRAEIRLLAETMKNGFREMDQRFERMDQKMDFIRENLESQIKSTRENLELQIKSTENQIKSTRENLEIQIKSNKESLDKQLALQQKLLWAVLTVVFGILVKTLVLP
jgi:hypothetical protein